MRKICFSAATQCITAFTSSLLTVPICCFGTFTAALTEIFIRKKNPVVAGEQIDVSGEGD